MRTNTKRRAIIDLTEHMEGFIEDFVDIHDLPYLPPGLAELMAEQAFAVIEILEAGESAMRADGKFKEGE